MSAADIIGILGFTLQMAGKLCDALQIIVDAPEELEALQIEVIRVKGFLAQIVETSDDAGRRDDKSPDVLRLRCDLIEQARKLIGDANQLVEKVTKLNGSGVLKVKRITWLCHTADVKNLVDNFRELYLAISAVYAVDASTRTRSIESSIPSLDQIKDAMRHEVTSAMERLPDEDRMVQIMVRSLTIVSRQQREGRHQLFDELSPRHSITDVSHVLPSRRLSLTHDNHGLAPSSPCGEPGLSTTTTHTDIQTISTSSISHSLHTTSLSEHVLPPYSMLGPPRRRCPPDCRCRCHKRSNDYRPVPHALRSWIGDIRIPQWLMTSLTSSSRPCDDTECMQTRETLSVVKWYLPEWFARVHTEVAFQSIPVHFVIQTPRVVKSLDFVVKLSFEDLKMKLSTRELTVNDIGPEGGTVLHRMAYVIVHDRRSDAHEMMRYLLDAGAPQDWEYDGQTVTEYVTSMATRWYGDTSTASAHLRSFEYNIARPLLHEGMEDAWERIRTKRGWSDLHYLLANPPIPPARVKMDLARILGQPDAALYLNARDCIGQTPLHQAIRSCPEAVDAPLRAGANPHLVGTSLGSAVLGFSWRAIGPLVRAGADVNKRYRRQSNGISTALHDVIRLDSALGPGARLPCALELVRHAGHFLDWDVEDERGHTPLWWAGWRMERHPGDEDVASIYKLYKTRRLPLNAQLIDRSRLGEEAEAAIRLESTSLIKAALAGNVQAVRELIDAGTMVNERDASGRTLLQLVAMGVVPNGYAIALELVQHGGYGVDWDALTVDGETAEELAQETLEYLSTLGNANAGKKNGVDDNDNRADSDVGVGDGYGCDGGPEAHDVDENAANNSIKVDESEYSDNDRGQSVEYDEATDILFLLQDWTLPQGMNNGLRMPGGFDCD